MGGLRVCVDGALIILNPTPPPHTHMSHFGVIYANTISSW